MKYITVLLICLLLTWCNSKESLNYNQYWLQCSIEWDFKQSWNSHYSESEKRDMWIITKKDAYREQNWWFVIIKSSTIPNLLSLDEINYLKTDDEKKAMYLKLNNTLINYKGWFQDDPYVIKPVEFMRNWFKRLHSTTQEWWEETIHLFTIRNSTIYHIILFGLPRLLDKFRFIGDSSNNNRPWINCNFTSETISNDEMNWSKNTVWLYEKSTVKSSINKKIYVKYRWEVLIDEKYEFQEFDSRVKELYYDKQNEYLIILLWDTYYHYCNMPNTTWLKFIFASNQYEYYENSIYWNYDCRKWWIPH